MRNYMAYIFAVALLFNVLIDKGTSAQGVERTENTDSGLEVSIGDITIDRQAEVDSDEQKVSEDKQSLENKKKETEVLKKKTEKSSKEIEQLRNEIEALRGKIAEKRAEKERKKAEEAARIVTISKYDADSAGNGYAAGNCTWYVKSRRPDIGSHWGNANQWLASAQSAGFSTGGTPKQGAIGVSFNGYYGHVVYIESVSADGSTVQLSEMNAKGLGVISSRTAPASSFQYIYSRT